VSARSKARKASLDILFEADIRGTLPLDILASREVRQDDPDAHPLRDYTREIVIGVAEHRRKIDELIATYAQGWDMDRLPAVDRNIMRLALYEILWSPDLDDAVAIDEALSLAKELSTDESAGYIHGVLGRIASIKDGLSL
jgi:N utilization substance protein B